MKIIRTLNTSSASYDLMELTDKDFNTLCHAYEFYMHHIRHCPPAENDELWKKMRKLQEEKITIF